MLINLDHLPISCSELRQNGLSSIEQALFQRIPGVKDSRLRVIRHRTGGLYQLENRDGFSFVYALVNVPLTNVLLAFSVAYPQRYKHKKLLKQVKL